MNEYNEDDMEVEENEEDYTPREYQSILLDKCKSSNTILYLPTGSGKTYIAVMLIKEMSSDVMPSLENSGKRTFFVVNTVALASQQAEYIQRHTPLAVGHYTGDLKINYWKKYQWEREFKKNQVLVMTCEILCIILQSKFFDIQNINLLIFDECHHGVKNHSMNQVMNFFKNCPENQQPLVLGLTATVLNGNCKVANVMNHVKGLEKNFRSTVATLEDISVVQGFSTCPVERIVTYRSSETCSVLEQLREYIKKCEQYILMAIIDSDKKEHDENTVNGARKLQDIKKKNKDLKNTIIDVIYQIETLGLYGGSLAALKALIEMERLRLTAVDAKSKILFVSLITTFNMIRKLLEDAMSGCDDKTKIYKYSSPKVITLINLLRERKPMENVNDLLRGIIFVERRTTATIMHFILKALHEHDEDFSLLYADYITGYTNNPAIKTCEGVLEKKWNTEVMSSFNKGIKNIIVSTSVLEEGIDVQECNLVVKFDLPKHYCSYVQSKGRARHKTSMYIILVPEHEKDKWDAQIIVYQEVEKVLKTIVAEKHVPIPEEHSRSENQYEYFVNGVDSARVTMNSAIGLVNRYCCMLPHDKFTNLAPRFYLQPSPEIPDMVQCFLHLPINCPVRDRIMGKGMPNRRLAKQIVALEASKALYQAGELDDHLQLRIHRVVEMEYAELFQMYDSNESSSSKSQQTLPGTYKRKRYYRKDSPQVLFRCKPQDDRPVYLHVIELKPTFEQPHEENTKRHTFFKLFEAKEGFALLSSKKLPLLCDFPIFLSTGEVNVSVKCNHEELYLTAGQLTALNNFSIMIFMDLLNLCKSFMTVDIENEENSYFIVPTKLGAHGRHEINWNLVHNHPSIPRVTQPSAAARSTLVVTPEKFYPAVVVPWYRGLLEQVCTEKDSKDQQSPQTKKRRMGRSSMIEPIQTFVVTKVCYDMSPSSPFSSCKYSTFQQYYKTKYDLDVQNDQPLLQVKAVSNSLSSLRPRLDQMKQLGLKDLDEESDAIYLIPELCFRHTFPAVLWLKALCLPVILHRMNHLLLAEELRFEIAQDLGFTSENGAEWESLKVDELCSTEEELFKSCVNNQTRQTQKAKSSRTKVELWGNEEPVDINRESFENLTFQDIEDYHIFIHKPLKSADRFRKREWTHTFATPTADFPCSRISLRPIEILQMQPSVSGPQLCQVLQALTTNSANDVVNLERLETLGDSFLKFSASLFLVLYCPQLDEGKLTQIKGKMVGNRNLYYCGKARRLGSIMKVQDFATSEWIPPGFCAPRYVQKKLRDMDLCSTFLYEKMELSQDEQRQGALTSATLDRIEEQLKTWSRHRSFSSSDIFVGVQTVSDKVVADSVEALLGTYLQACGVEGAVQLLGWFRILPPEKATCEWLLKSPSPPALMNATATVEDVYHHLPLIQVQELERYLDYHFRDPSYLLQALTHASFAQNRLTDCYQRLEFLGDAILDFLITCHIYETCDNLSPGELTDLRSALVNNITFGSLAVRHNFHKYCKYESSLLFNKVDTFVQFQEERNHRINEDVFILLEEDDCKLAVAVDVPKMLGDLFESMAAAIYLDSGKSLDEVWRVYQELMKEEIYEFSRNIPKQPVRLLYENCQVPPVFNRSLPIADGRKVMVELEVNIAGKIHKYHGVGENKPCAKRAAAKLALRDICN